MERRDDVDACRSSGGRSGRLNVRPLEGLGSSLSVGAGFRTQQEPEQKSLVPGHGENSSCQAGSAAPAAIRLDSAGSVAVTEVWLVVNVERE